MLWKIEVINNEEFCEPISCIRSNALMAPASHFVEIEIVCAAPRCMVESWNLHAEYVRRLEVSDHPYGVVGRSMLMLGV